MVRISHGHRKVLEQIAGSDHPSAARARGLLGLHVPISSLDPIPDSTPPPVVEVVNPAAARVALPVRIPACKSLGKCPVGRSCGEQYRVCNAGHGEVRHLHECQACLDYVAKELTRKG